MQDHVTKSIIQLVQEKQEFTYLSEDFIESEITRYLIHHRAHRTQFDTLEHGDIKYDKHIKTIVKHVRNKARDIYGIYQIKAHTRQQLLDKKDFEGLLRTHLSVKERLNDYTELYTLLDKEVDLSSVMDIACGLNPLTFKWMPKIPKTIIAVEMSKLDADFLQKCFDTFGIKAKAYGIDASYDHQALHDLGAVKTVFLFKALDVLEKQHKNSTYVLLQHLQTQSIVVSFTTVNIKQQPLRQIRRNWFEKVCNRLEYTYEMHTIGNELFYILHKKSGENSQ